MFVLVLKAALVKRGRIELRLLEVAFASPSAERSQTLAGEDLSFVDASLAVRSLYGSRVLELAFRS